MSGKIGFFQSLSIRSISQKDCSSGNEIEPLTSAGLRPSSEKLAGEGGREDPS